MNSKTARAYRKTSPEARICFQHDRILGITLTFIRQYPGNARKGVTVLTGASRDGDILAQLVGQFGMGVVRGSSSRRGSRALRELVDLAENGHDIAITPDGPRGPRYSLGPGAISRAQLTDTPIVPMHARFSRCLHMKSWDGFIIPIAFFQGLGHHRRFHTRAARTE